MLDFCTWSLEGGGKQGVEKRSKKALYLSSSFIGVLE
jgi:hypothetical protein